MANPDEVAAGRPVVLRGGTVLTMDDAHTILARRGRAGDRRQDRRGGTAPGGAGRRARDRRERRHRDAGDDRHAPAHVADGDARLRRGLDADPVLRLELPGARPEVPPRGHPRGQPRLGLGVPRGRRDHHAWTGRTTCRPPTTPRPPSTRCRAVPGRFVLAYGNIQAGPWEWTADPAVRSFFEPAPPARRHARVPARLRRHRRPGLPGEGGVRGGPRARPAGHHPRRRVGGHQRRRHPADARERVHDPGERSTCTRPP